MSPRRPGEHDDLVFRFKKKNDSMEEENGTFAAPWLNDIGLVAESVATSIIVWIEIYSYTVYRFRVRARNIFGKDPCYTVSEIKVAREPGIPAQRTRY